MVANFKQKAVRDLKHLDFIRSLPCVVCVEPPRSQAAHIRRGEYSGGMGLKPNDSATVPLCARCHHTQHQCGELKFWFKYGGYEKAQVLAKALYKLGKDKDAALGLVLGFKK